MADGTVIDTLFQEQREIVDYLQKKGEWSYAQRLEAFLSKSLLLSIASYFESRITAAITDYTTRVTGGDEGLMSLVRIRVIKRQYHTYFDWEEDKRNSGKFFSMFGTTLKDTAKKDLREDAGLKHSCDDFLELGSMRNVLVHENFASYPLEKTAGEIYERYKSALAFVAYIEVKLNPPPAADPMARVAPAEPA